MNTPLVSVILTLFKGGGFTSTSYVLIKKFPVTDRPESQRDNWEVGFCCRPVSQIHFWLVFKNPGVATPRDQSLST